MNASSMQTTPNVLGATACSQTPYRLFRRQLFHGQPAETPTRNLLSYGSDRP
jgi:hypothetical protein